MFKRLQTDLPAGVTVQPPGNGCCARERGGIMGDVRVCERIKTGKPPLRPGLRPGETCARGVDVALRGSCPAQGLEIVAPCSHSNRAKPR